ncbi:pyrroline-5-carboxylate reductase [Ceraceosorus bombacis]|uniref:Pyrroline-5-carboxylate reductase n=1 Tax=Ceraceosorus bombacis TaxID=401625 RepID=A0A0P1BQ66_9BASI|nr:pyrroline-5-carboxylate reductase [Ceraceosorus bombacis]
MSSSITSQSPSPSSVAECAGAGSAGPPYTLGIVGCGTMGIAILSGILASSKAFAAAALLQSQVQSQSVSQSGSGADFANEALSESVADLLGEEEGEEEEEERRRKRMELKYLPGTFYACVARQESARRLKSVFAKEEGEGSVRVVAGDNVLAAQRCDVVLLACKPHMVADILREEGMRDALKGKLVISICAGLRIQQIAHSLHPTSTVVRAMPNTPSKIREGMTVLTPLPSLSSSSSSSSTSHAHSRSRSRLLSIFNAIGKCRFLDEKHFDAATALAGSGPAFACVFLEAMADGGVMMGLPRKEALELAAQSMQGAARMVLQSGAHPASIKDSVTTAAEHAAGLGQVKK